MRILILGYGKLGAHLAASLAKEGHTITVLDSDPARLEPIAQYPHTEGVLASGYLLEDLRRVGMDSVDAFLAVLDDDNTNAMAAQVASHIFHVSDVICHISDPERQTFYEKLGVNVVCPTSVLVESIHSSLKNRH